MEPTTLCCLLKAVCITLRFPARASTAAHTYLRHYLRHQHLIQPQQNPTDQALLAACVLLASKVEEVPVSNNHLLNVTAVLHDLLVKKHMSLAVLLGGPEDDTTSTQQPAEQPQPAAPPTTSQGGRLHAPAPAPGSNVALPSAAMSRHEQQGMAGPPAAGSRGHAPESEPHNGAPGSATGQAQAACQSWDTAALKAAVSQCSVLVGDTYQHQKMLVLEAEQQLLRLLQWQLLVCQPTATLLQAAAAFRVPFTLLTGALFILNDAIVFSDVLLPPRQPGPPDSHNTGHTSSAGGAVPARPGENGALVHMSEAGLHDTRRELLVAAACLVTAADMSAELDLLTCAACRHAFASRAQHRHDSNGSGDVVMGQGMSQSIVDGQPRCRHWLGLLGLQDVHAVEQYALYIYQHMRQAQAALNTWEQGAVHA